jgi:hypothetical protein
VHALCGVYLGVLCAYNAVRFATVRGRGHAVNTGIYAAGVVYELMNAQHHWSHDQAEGPFTNL